MAIINNFHMIMQLWWWKQDPQITTHLRILLKVGTPVLISSIGLIQTYTHKRLNRLVQTTCGICALRFQLVFIP